MGRGPDGDRHEEAAEGAADGHADLSPGELGEALRVVRAKGRRRRFSTASPTTAKVDERKEGARTRLAVRCHPRNAKAGITLSLACLPRQEDKPARPALVDVAVAVKNLIPIAPLGGLSAAIVR